MTKNKNSIKIDPDTRATFASIGGNSGATEGARMAARAWRDAGWPQLPAEPCPYGECTLEKMVAWWDPETREVMVIAGAGKGASSGARRLALWERLRQEATQQEV